MSQKNNVDAFWLSFSMNYDVMVMPPHGFCLSAATFAKSIQKQILQYHCTFAVVCKLLDGLVPLQAFVVLYFSLLIKQKLLRKLQGGGDDGLCN